MRSIARRFEEPNSSESRNSRRLKFPQIGQSSAWATIFVPQSLAAPLNSEASSITNKGISLLKHVSLQKESSGTQKNRSSDDTARFLLFRAAVWATVRFPSFRDFTTHY